MQQLFLAAMIISWSVFVILCFRSLEISDRHCSPLLTDGYYGDKWVNDYADKNQAAIRARDLSANNRYILNMGIVSIIVTLVYVGIKYI